MPSNRVINLQLVDETGKALSLSGGMVQVCVANSPDKVAISDINQASIANPVALNRGQLYAEVAKSVTSVDLFIMSPTGHFVVLKGVVPGDRQSVQINTKDLETVVVVPFSIVDSTANTEKDTGFDLPTGAQVKAMGLGAEISTLEAARTISAGILSTEPSGSATGFINAISTAAAVNVKATLLNGAQTLGALLRVQDSANAGDLVPESHVVLSTSRSISYTLSASTVSAKGYLHIPVALGIISTLPQ